MARSATDLGVPALFVVLWSTGFVGAKLGLPYAEPFTFLALRFGIVAVLLAVVVALSRCPLPARRIDLLHIAIVGLLVHGIYLGAVFAAVDIGINAGIAAVVVGAQPLLTALLVGPLLGERLGTAQWNGLLLGFGGVLMVLWREIDVAGADLAGLVITVAGLLGITLGTLYQKKFCSHMDLRSGSLIQYVAAGLLMTLLSLTLERRDIVWSGEFFFALAWLVLVLSLGAVTLLWILIRRGAAAKVASLFYLVPPTVAIMSFFLFDERLSALGMLGVGCAAAGVALVNRVPTAD